MKLFGLTGGIGMGKSTSARLLAERGIAVIDTDLIARQVVEPGQPALAEIVDGFGLELLDGSGGLRRSVLAEIVFASPEKLKKLEAILHPRIREQWTGRVEEWRREGREAAAVVIPLLFETNARPQFDAVFCVACSSATQQERLRTRGWSNEQIQQRLNAQWPIEKKIAASDYVLWTEGALSVHARQVDIVLERYLTSRR
jgi:dephospho-CoA kinase